ncbi:MAG: GNAT family N-acetyltransferase [Leptolyngbya foveolarum]|uniref:GNAT family N-acetyltransferase n=1 Tax=Leptolyngbya foveolarum TaxID=47253 RepID=A0A2W4UKY0_9CYAN|nr:MAG: GNAT family N-acetyltransferase [Leptolyngbya foveolarum]
MSATNGEPTLPLKPVVVSVSKPSGQPSLFSCAAQSTEWVSDQSLERLSERSPEEKSAPIRVRAARIEDLPQMIAVLLSSFYPQVEATHWFYWLMRIGIREDIRTRLKTHSSQYACLVAAKVNSTASKKLSAGTVIGTIEISQRPCETWRFFPPRRAYLSNLAIDSTYRRQGAAKQLLHTCESVALQWGFDRVYLHVMADNQAARSLYTQAGYQPCEVSNPILAGLGLRPERLLLSKRLQGEVNQ